MPNTLPKEGSFEGELTELINKYSLEPLSNTPDFILAFYLKDCLLAWQNAQTRRTVWYQKQFEQKKEIEKDKERVEERASQLGSLE